MAYRPDDEGFAGPRLGRLRSFSSCFCFEGSNDFNKLLEKSTRKNLISELPFWHKTLSQFKKWKYSNTCRNISTVEDPPSHNDPFC